MVAWGRVAAAAAISGEAASGRSSGQALQIMEQMADAKLPNSMGYEWTGVSYQEKRVGREYFLIHRFARTDESRLPALASPARLVSSCWFCEGGSVKVRTHEEESI